MVLHVAGFFNRIENSMQATELERAKMGVFEASLGAEGSSSISGVLGRAKQLWKG
jgi:hypothetical protein